MTVTIFLADPAAMFREALWLLLEKQPGFKVVGSADDGLTAVREMDELSPDIAIVEINLPGLDGIEVTRELARLDSQTRVIILTMCTVTHTVVEALRAGAFGYVFKSSLSSEIIEAIQNIAAGKKYLHPTLSQSGSAVRLSHTPARVDKGECDICAGDHTTHEIRPRSPDLPPHSAIPYSEPQQRCALISPIIQEDPTCS